MNVMPRNEFEAWALPHFSGGDPELSRDLARLNSHGDYRSPIMRAARDAWAQNDIDARAFRLANREFPMAVEHWGNRVYARRAGSAVVVEPCGPHAGVERIEAVRRAIYRMAREARS